MESRVIKKSRLKSRRAIRVRKNLRGTSEKPRLSVVKTNDHVHVQLIDDSQGKTIASTGTNAREFKGSDQSKKNRTSAKALGQRIGELAKEQKVEHAIFDRGSSKYHGILAELADGAREAGLKF